MDFTINLESKKKKKQIFTTKDKSYAPKHKA